MTSYGSSLYGMGTYGGDWPSALWPSTDLFPNTDVYPGQGTLPIVRAQVAFDDVSVASPTWTDVTADLRGFQVSRGRNSELDEMGAGTATIALNNRARAYDPNANATVRPLNRVRLFAECSGSVYPIFTGYVEAWQQTWDPSGIVDAVATIRAVDEFKILNLAKLPTMSPPRDTYADYIMVDDPVGYWRFQDDALNGVTGGNFITQGTTYTLLNETPITGAKIGPFASGNSGVVRFGGSGQQIYVAGSGVTGGGTSAFTIEVWLRPAGAPAVERDILVGPNANVAGIDYRYWLVRQKTDGTLRFEIYNGGGPTQYTVTSTVALTASVWTHCAFVVDGANLRIYLNGSQNTTAAFAGSMLNANQIVSNSYADIEATTSPNLDFAELAIYNTTLSATTIGNHYSTALNRGFAAGQLPGARINQALDAVTSRASRSIDSGVYQMQGMFMTGQPSIEVLRAAATSDKADGAVFVTAGGTIKFLDSDHRSSSPYNTAQATYGDGGGAELPYLDCEIDYSETFLANKWEITKDGGTTQTASDATSIARYYTRAQAISNLPITSDTDAGTIATTLLAKYKDPFQRIISIKPNMADPATADATLARELMDKIRIYRRPPGGGLAIDQSSWIQKIDLSGAPGRPISCTLGVSPR